MARPPCRKSPVPALVRAALAAGAVAVTTLLATPVAGIAAGTGVQNGVQDGDGSARIEIVSGHHAAGDGRPDQLRIVCRDGEDNVDVALPRRWVDFMIRRLDAEIEIDGDSLDLRLLWATIADLRPGEEILIREHGGSMVRIWLE